MSPLSSTSVADEVLEALTPTTFGTVGDTGPLFVYINGLGQMFQYAETFSSDDPDTGAIGYSQWVDVERAPEEVLPWLAQFVGIQLSDTKPYIDDQVVATNRILNPSAEEDTFSVFPVSDMSVYSSDEFVKYGRRCFKCVFDQGTGTIPNVWFSSDENSDDYWPVTPGSHFSVGAWAKRGALAGDGFTIDGLKWVTQWLDADKNQLSGIPNTNGADTLLSDDNWHEVIYTDQTVPLNASYVWLQIASNHFCVPGDSFYIDGVVYVDGNTQYVDNYFDGDIHVDGTKISKWTGIPHRSASELLIPGTGYVKRSKLRTKRRWTRGSPMAMIEDAQETLTGQKRVVLQERFGGDPYKLNVTTFISETPDSAATLKALIGQKPAGIVMTYSAIAAYNFQTVLDNNATFQTLMTKYATFNGLLLDVPGA